VSQKGHKGLMGIQGPVVSEREPLRRSPPSLRFMPPSLLPSLVSARTFWVSSGEVGWLMIFAEIFGHLFPSPLPSSGICWISFGDERANNQN
jgi:hypothetical protein